MVASCALRLRRALGLALLLLIMLGGPAASAQQAGRSAAKPKNVILFISDGCGPASFTMARDYLRLTNPGARLALDELLVGNAATHSTNSRITDSAAGATAYAAGVKTYNGAISVDDDRRPVPTVLEAAEAAGLATGLVATCRITHATPAAFAAHVPSRNMEAEIAAQMARQGIDVILGGGRAFFLPQAAGGARADSLDVLADLRRRGVTVFDDPAALGAAKAPLVGLMAPDHLRYEIDRPGSGQPSLAEMTRRALELLSKQSEKGFFVMIEGSRIDHAAHGNDPAAHLFDLLAYDAAVAEALDFARKDGQTLIVSTSDHETGGLTLGRKASGDGAYSWDPSVLGKVKASRDVLGRELHADPAAAPATFARLAGIDSLSAADTELLRTAVAAGEGAAGAAAVDIISRRASVGWTTGGHTAVDVPLFAFGPGRERFIGHYDNTYVGKTIAELLGLKLDLARR